MRLTEVQQADIRRKRVEGLGYLKISQEMNLSVNTVHSFCRRNGLAGRIIKQDEVIPCKCCGHPMTPDHRRKGQKFCSESCRMKWWARNRDKLKKKAIYSFVCAHCGKEFTAYGNTHRKYCSHDCYIADRFGGDLDE